MFEKTQCIKVGGVMQVTNLHRLLAAINEDRLLNDPRLLDAATPIHAKLDFIDDNKCGEWLMFEAGESGFKAITELCNALELSYDVCKLDVCDEDSVTQYRKGAKPVTYTGDLEALDELSDAEMDDINTAIDSGTIDAIVAALDGSTTNVLPPFTIV